MERLTKSEKSPASATNCSSRLIKRAPEVCPTEPRLLSQSGRVDNLCARSWGPSSPPTSGARSASASACWPSSLSVWKQSEHARTHARTHLLARSLACARWTFLARARRS